MPTKPKGSSPAAPREVAPHASGANHAHALGRERVIEIQRARILAAMAQECAARGAGNVTVAHVVARAGVSRRTFYELFADREDCFIGAFNEAVARASRHVLHSYDPRARWAERIRIALTNLLAFLDMDADAGQLLVVDSLGAGPKSMEHRRRVVAQIVSAIDEGRSESKATVDLPPLTADGIVGGVLSVLHSRLLDRAPRAGSESPIMAQAGSGSLLELAGPLMGMIVLPYLGPFAARRELARPVPESPLGGGGAGSNPLGELEMRLTYRTVRVLMAIAAHPGSSNRIVADAAEVTDQGQMSKLLARLRQIKLIENTGGGASRGEPNSWTLTDKGWQLQGAIARQTTHG